MNRIWISVMAGLLMVLITAPALPQTEFEKRGKSCFDSQKYALVPCPKSGKSIFLTEKKRTPRDEALSFLQELAPYTKLDDNGNPLPESAEEWAMVRDNERGLIWEAKSRDRNSIHFFADRYDWKDLQKGFIEPLNEENFGGFSDWRLPTARDLSTLMIPSARVPNVDLDFFPNTRPNSYWTGLFRTDTPDYACHVDFYLGNVHFSPKSRKNYVRAVRMAEEFRDTREVALPDGKRFKEPRGGITDPSPDGKKKQKDRRPAQREASERFKKPRSGVTD